MFFHHKKMDKRKFYVDIRRRTHGKYRKIFRLSSDQMDDSHNRMECRQPMSQLWSRPCLLLLVVEWENRLDERRDVVVMELVLAQVLECVLVMVLAQVWAMELVVGRLRVVVRTQWVYLAMDCIDQCLNSDLLLPSLDKALVVDSESVVARAEEELVVDSVLAVVPVVVALGDYSGLVVVVVVVEEELVDYSELVAVVVVAEGAMVGYIEVVVVEVVGALADAVVDSSFDIVELHQVVDSAQVLVVAALVYCHHSSLTSRVLTVVVADQARTALVVAVLWAAVALLDCPWFAR